MKVGIKYCGGCNPRYERKKFVDRIRQKIRNGYEIEVVKEDDVYDFLLIIGGCTNCCASYRHIKTEQGILYVKSEEDYEKAVDSLRKISINQRGE